MNTFTEVEKQVLILTVRKLFTKKWFDICLLQDLAKVLKREAYLSGKVAILLSTLHCTDWRDMTPEIREYVKISIFEILGLPLETEIEIEIQAEPQQKVDEGIVTRLLNIVKGD